MQASLSALAYSFISLLSEAIWLLASGEFFRYIQDGGYGWRKASVANEEIRNTQFDPNCGRLPYLFHAAKHALLAAGTAIRNFVAKNQRTRAGMDDHCRKKSHKT